MATPRECLVFQAMLAEQVERYDEMAEALKAVAAMGGELSPDERNLFSAAYKNVVGTRRASWRLVTAYSQKATTEKEAACSAAYRIEIETELKALCLEVLGVISTSLLPSATSPESKVLFQKMEGDYYRYLAEILGGSELENVVDKALAAYTLATETAEKTLPATHPLRLGLALNFSVFHFEILSSAPRACELASTAFEAAVAELSDEDGTFQDSTVIMQLLRDNLSLWSSETDTDDHGADNV